MESEHKFGLIVLAMILAALTIILVTISIANCVEHIAFVREGYVQDTAPGYAGWIWRKPYEENHRKDR